MKTTLLEKTVELESALAKQKAELEEKCAADFDAAMEEEAQRLAIDYKAQLQRIKDEPGCLDGRPP